MGKRGIPYVGRKVFIGIDVHRLRYSVSVVVDGELVERISLRAEPEILLEYLKMRFAGADVQSVYEAGFSGFVLHRRLEEAGIRNIVVNAGAVEISSRDRVKTDKRDSLKLATQLAAGRLKGIRVPSQEEELHRQLTRTREQIVKNRKQVMQQIRMRLHYFGYIGTEQRGVLQKRFVDSLLEQSMAKELRSSLEGLRAIWDACDEQIACINRSISIQAKHDTCEQIYRSVPGFGPLTSRILSNELGNMGQFSSEGGLFSYCGLTPSEFSTGEKQHRGHISRQGSSRLRAILVEAAWVAIRKDKELHQAFTRIASRAGKKRAIVAIARKLIGRARALFRTTMLYEMKEAA